jgi:hypothetical protein
VVSFLMAAHAAPAMAGADDPTAIPTAARDLADRVRAARGHAGLPFAVVDKKEAMLMVYFGDGRLAGVTPVLLGRTLGDQSVAGVGERAQLGQLRVDDRTTPAGRFTSEPGHNLAGEPIVWIDYDNALAIHRLRPGPSRDFRERRLASPSALDRRVSAGCVVVPTAFYDEIVAPVLGRGRGVVYVMGEDGSIRSL